MYLYARETAEESLLAGTMAYWFVAKCDGRRIGFGR
jgi:hypothetical protein